MKLRDVVLYAGFIALPTAFFLLKQVSASTNEVYQFLSDYQDEPNGGNGWLRIMNFRPNENLIDVKTYSPYLNQYMTDADSQLQIPYVLNAGDPFTVIVLPDTQNYSAYRPDIFLTQTNWIATNALAMNTVFVVHVGDIVDNYTILTQWQNSKTAMNVLDSNNIPYSVLPGNHDFNPLADNFTSSYFMYYPPQTKKAYYAGSYNNDNFNNVNKISVGNNKIMFLNLQFNPPQGAIDWANMQIADNPDYKVVLSTHEYLLNYAIPASRSFIGENLFKQIVVPNADQMLFVLCGHYHGEAVKRGQYVLASAVKKHKFS